MSWIKLTSVTATNGSNIVAVTSGSTAGINVGDGLQIGAFELCEIVAVYASQLQLRDNWGNATQTSAAAIVVPTFGDFNSAVTAMRDLTDVAVSNLSVIEDWGTKTGNVSFTGQDGNTYSARTLAQMDADVGDVEADAQVKIDAMVEMLNNGVYGSKPVLSIPFNDSGRIERGFGTNDQIDVSAAQDGSIMVDLPTKSVDFTCAATRYWPNKSGVLQEYASNELIIDENGAFCGHASYINNCLQNQDMTANPWILNATPPTVSVSTELSSDLTNYMFEIEDTSDTINSQIQQTITQDFTSGICVYLEVKQGTATQNRISLQGTITLSAGLNIAWNGGVPTPSSVGGASLTFKVKKLVNGAYGIWAYTSEDIGTATATPLYIWPAGYQADGSATGSVYLANLCIFNIGYPVPITKTYASAVSVPAAICSTPNMNNLPAPGEPFAIRFDCDFSAQGDVGAFGAGLDAYEKITCWRFSSGVNITFRISDGVTALSTSAVYADTLGYKRYVCKFDGENLSIHVEGVKKSSLDASALDWSNVYSPEGTMYIGRTAPSGVNSKAVSNPIRNFEIYHGVISDEEIASWGAA